MADLEEGLTGRYPDLVGRACFGNTGVEFEAERDEAEAWLKKKSRRQSLRENAKQQWNEFRVAPFYHYPSFGRQYASQILSGAGYSRADQFYASYKRCQAIQSCTWQVL
ncbi:hypothetical protein L6164_001590 [Bauhinia variegata]|uniref:Uncharacterized protein n=1 Tax=Bauhinia variegata TaxID=167791 RepID=A0ACB9Q9G6_BAUVA|nr:hypothetical protein L6164_001590 [Bauhinia variegata]